MKKHSKVGGRKGFPAYRTPSKYRAAKAIRAAHLKRGKKDWRL